MSKKTKSGYEVTIKAFIPFDPTYMLESLDPRAIIAGAKEYLVAKGCEDVAVSQPKYRHRKKTAEPEVGQKAAAE